jgi:hypothetical protein
MKKSIIAVSVCAVLVFLLLAWAALASAQQATGYNMGIQAYNMSADEANIVVVFCNMDGSVAASVGYAIDGYSSINLYPLDVANGFSGSVVIYSDKPLVSVANLQATGTVSINASFEGFSDGESQVNLPLIMRNNPIANPINTWLQVQNIGTEDAEVRVDYYPNPGVGNPDTEYATIAPDGAARFAQADNTDLGSRFVGSAVVSSTNSVPVVAMVNEERVGTNDALLSYSGFLASYGSDTVALPLVMSNNGAAKLWTGIQVQNAGTLPTTITVSYSPNVNGTWNPAGPDVATDIAPGESANFLNDNTVWSAGNTYVGSATATSSNGQALVAIVNQTGLKNGAFWGSSYTGIDPDAATSEVVLPLIMSCNPTCNRLWTGFNVQNVDATNPTTLTVSFVPSPGYATKTDEVAVDVGPGEVVNFLQNAGATANWDGTRWIGSAVISASDGAPIVAIVNESWWTVTSTDGDRLLTYDGFNAEPSP